MHDLASREEENSIEVEEMVGEGSVEVIDIEDDEATAMEKVGLKTRPRVAVFMEFLLSS